MKKTDKDIELKEPDLNLLVEAWDEYKTNEVTNPVVCKDHIIESLEKERKFATEINEPIMALGISRAIQIIKEL